MNNLHKQMITEVCKDFKCCFDEVFTSRRYQRLVYAKKIIYWVLRKEGLTFNQIANMLHKDHETVLVGARSLPESFQEYALKIYSKYKKISFQQTREQNLHMIKHKAIRVASLLNQGYSVEQISKTMKEDVEPIVILYIDKKKIPNYQTGTMRTEFFFKKNKNNY